MALQSSHKYHVVTTISPATAVTCSMKGRFINPLEENLILCKGSKVEIYNILETGIKSFLEFNIYGIIAAIQTCTIPEKETCSLFLLTDQSYFTILTYSSKTQSIFTEGHGKLEEPHARATDQSVSVIIDLPTSTILVSAFTGFLFSIPFIKSDVKGKSRETRLTRFEPASIKTNEFDFLSMVSLQGARPSSIAVLLGEVNELKTIKTFKYCPTPHNEIVEIEKLTVMVEATTHMLIAVPNPIGGVIAVGEYIISYHDLTTTSGNSAKESSIDPVLVTAYTFMDNSHDKCILGDVEGNLYLLSLQISNMKVTGISSTIIGQVSLATSIVDLGNNLLYIGSSQGDSCLVKLISDNKFTRYSIKVLDQFPNLGPILDFCLFDYDQQGKQTMVCCSGVDKDGSLRVVENGVGFLEKYVMHVPLVDNVWALSSSDTADSKSQDMLIVSTATETMILKQTSENEMKEYSKYSGLLLNEITLMTAHIASKTRILQVTPSCVRIIENQVQGNVLSEWTPPMGQQINIAISNETQCVLCYGKGMLVCLDIITGNGLVQTNEKQFDDISCINLYTGHENGTNRDCVLIGMWTDCKVLILDLINFLPVLEHSLSDITRTGPKDVLCICLEDIQYLMILLGDGQLISLNIDFKDMKLSNKRQNMVGTYCTAMYTYQTKDKVFIAGLRPTIITSRHQTLCFSAVNLKNVYSLVEYNEMVILMTDTGLSFGQTDTAQKLHHTKVALGKEMPTRIQYLTDSKSLAVGTIFNEKDMLNGFVKQVGKIQILDAQTFRVLTSYHLPGNELVECMTVAKFDGYYNQEFLVVGTAIENSQDPDQSQGRILIFDIKKENTSFELLEAVEMPGIIYSVKAFQNSIVASVNGSIYSLQQFKLDATMGEKAEFKCNIHSNVLALAMDTRGDKVLVGDLMQSMSVLKMTCKDPLNLTLLASDNKPSWMTAVKFVNDQVVIGADDRNNIFTCILDEEKQKKAAKKQDNPIVRLAVEGGYHIGSLINTFRQGILQDIQLSSAADTSTSSIESIEAPFTFTTVHGSIGHIKTISEESFELFYVLQDNIIRESANIGKLDHQEWRGYKPKIPNKSNPAAVSNYIDGDILNKFQYMSKKDKTRVLTSNPLLSTYQIHEIQELVNTLIS